MTPQSYYQELPLVKDVPLPYTELFIPNNSPLFKGSIIVFFLSLAGLSTTWVSGNHLLLILVGAVCAIAGVILAWFALQTSRKKRQAKIFLRTRSNEMIEAAQERYGITLTETILYSLVQGGSSVLYYAKSDKRVQMMLGSDSTTRRTIMVTPTDILEE